MAQFPLEMGRKKKTSNALAVQVDAEGKIKYDAIARQGQGKDKVSCCMIECGPIVVYNYRFSPHREYSTC